MGIVSGRQAGGALEARERAHAVDDPFPSIDEQVSAGQPTGRERNSGRLPTSPLTIAAGATVILLATTVAAMWLTRPQVVAPLPSEPATSITQPDSAQRNAEQSNTDTGTQTTRITANEHGYSFAYPADWTVMSRPTTAEGATVLRISGDNAFSVRPFPLDHPIAHPQLSDMRALTDAVLSTPDAQLQIVDVRETTVGGAPAIYYLYYFPAGTQRGIHAHYFAFAGSRMYSLVFQVVPPESFSELAATFDQLVGSFELSP